MQSAFPHISSLKNRFKAQPKWLKWLVYAMSVLIIFYSIVAIAFSIYVHSHKSKILNIVTTQFSNTLQGNVVIKDLSPSIWKDFPFMAICLNGVSITDSLFPTHHIPTFEVENIYLQIKSSSILSKPIIDKVTICTGSVHLFTNDTGYTNIYALQPKELYNNSKIPSVQSFHIKLERIRFLMDYTIRHKHFDIYFKKLNAQIQKKNADWQIVAHVNSHVSQLGFNTTKGSFLEDQNVKGNISLSFNDTTQVLNIKKEKLIVNGDVIWMYGKFYLATSTKEFDVHFNAPQLSFANGLRISNNKIKQTLGKFNFKKPINVVLGLSGSITYPDTPRIKVVFKINNNTLDSKFGTFERANFTGYFTNEHIKGTGKNDANSIVNIPTLTANWEGVPIQIDSINITNLKNPFFQAHIHSTFQAKDLNEIAKKTFQFEKGTVEVNVKYAGPIKPNDTTPSLINGYVFVKDASVQYLPRTVKIHQLNAQLFFTGQDLLFKNINIKTANSSIEMKGSALDFLNIYFTNPQQVNINWNVHAHSVDLQDFEGFITHRKIHTNTNSSPRSATVNYINTQINKAIDACNMQLNIDVNNVVYKKFAATQVQASIELRQSGIYIDHIRMYSSSGNLTLNGQILQQKYYNPFTATVTISNAQIDKLFYAFDNFDFGSLTYNNIKGNVQAQISLKGSFDKNGTLIRQNLNGDINVALDNGALIDFPPLLKIQRFIFKKRNLDSLIIAPLNAHFSIANNAIYIDPLLIPTNAFDFNIKGVYAFDNVGSNIHIALPLRNPEKNRERIAKGKTPRKGIIIYLQATDDKDGKMQINLDPQPNIWNQNSLMNTK